MSDRPTLDQFFDQLKKDVPNVMVIGIGGNHQQDVPLSALAIRSAHGSNAVAICRNGIEIFHVIANREGWLNSDDKNHINGVWKQVAHAQEVLVL